MEEGQGVVPARDALEEVLDWVLVPDASGLLHAGVQGGPDLAER